MQAPQDVLDFWFTEHGPDDWFAGKPELDAAIVARFAATHAAIARGEGFTWRSTIDGRLAEIIVLDQFSRQIHRGTAAAFASDGMALVLAQEAVGLGLDSLLDTHRRQFLYMPYEHAESLVVQAQSIRLFHALGDPEMMKFANWHLEVIQKFGRFPKRNAALGRTSTAAEIAYLESDAHPF